MCLEQASRKVQPWSQEAVEESPGGAPAFQDGSLEKFSLLLPKTVPGSRMLLVPKCMVRLLKMAVLLFSVHPLLHQSLLHLHPMHVTDLPTYLPQAPAGDCSYQKGGEGRALLLVSLVTNEPT